MLLLAFDLLSSLFPDSSGLSMCLLTLKVHEAPEDPHQTEALQVRLQQQKASVTSLACATKEKSTREISPTSAPFAKKVLFRDRTDIRGFTWERNCTNVTIVRKVSAGAPARTEVPLEKETLAVTQVL